MTPMIDVVFLLIIFFLVSSHLSQQEKLTPLQLPSAVSGLAELNDRQTLVVNVQSDGTWIVGGVVVDLPALESVMRRRIVDSEQPLQLRVRTDRDATYQKLKPVLATAVRLGVGDVVFSVLGEIEQ